LKIQNKALNEFQNSVLSTVYWSLGFLGSITALLVGFGWWSNFRIHDKDKESLRNEILSLNSEFESNWNSVISEFRRQDNLLLERRINEIKGYIDKETEEVKSQVKDVKGFSNKLEDNLKNLNSEFDDYKDVVNKSNHEQEFELRSVEQEVWGLRGIYSNVLLTQAQGIQSARNIGNYAVQPLLEDMKTTLEKIIEEEYECQIYFLDRAKEVVTSVEKNDVLVGQILSLLSKVKVRP
jgi:SMC interacting uncharacterized protein involved in chromosome segregation